MVSTVSTQVNAPATNGINDQVPADVATNVKTKTPTAQYRYRWRTGDCLAMYGSSAKIWQEYSSTEEFATGFEAIIDDETLTNEIRADRVEEYLID
jgi:hypothetical protein